MQFLTLTTLCRMQMELKSGKRRVFLTIFPKQLPQLSRLSVEHYCPQRSRDKTTVWSLRTRIQSFLVRKQPLRLRLCRYTTRVTERWLDNAWKILCNDFISANHTVIDQKNDSYVSFRSRYNSQRFQRILYDSPEIIRLDTFSWLAVDVILFSLKFPPL